MDDHAPHLISDELVSMAFTDMVDKLAKPGEHIQASLDPYKCHLLHMTLGVSGEVGELADAIKKHVMYDKPLDIDNVIEELGDIEFYLEGIRQALNLNRNRILNLNINKLLLGKNARYASGSYSNHQAQNRADKK